MPQQNDNHIIIEFVQMGSYVKVSAMDPKTLVEVSIVGDPTQDQRQLENIVTKKLRYVLEKKGGSKPLKQKSQSGWDV